jgi:hypothetical protein
MPYGTVNADLMTTSDGVSSSGLYGFKNRIYNGQMTIDQRYAGAAFGTSINSYTVDRWSMNQSVTGKLNGGRNYNSVTLPAGFANYLGFQSQSAYSISSSDYYQLLQPIEGFNTSDLAWGTANAKTVTLSFVVQSSLTGTFGGALVNAAQTRSYPFSYTISSANTWTTVAITIPGDTSGTWVGATNGVGINVNFSLGMGSSLSGTAGAWASAFYISATGATSVVGTNGATFYITGVQLEKGSTATSFDYRPYGTELQLCQRYFEIMEIASMYGAADNSTTFIGMYRFLIEKRSAPTLTILTSTPAVSEIGIAERTGSGSAIGNTFIGTKSMRYQINGFSSMTARNPLIGNGTTTGIISLSSEL